MLKNRHTKLSHHLTANSPAKSTEKTPPTKYARVEVDSSDLVKTNSTTHSGVNNNVSNKRRRVANKTPLNSDATRSIKTSSTSRATSTTPASKSHDELVQQILDAADMACHAKRVNQLMSYVSGIDYSPVPNSTYKPPRSGSDGSNENEYSLV